MRIYRVLQTPEKTDNFTSVNYLHRIGKCASREVSCVCLGWKNTLLCVRFLFRDKNEKGDELHQGCHWLVRRCTLYISTFNVRTLVTECVRSLRSRKSKFFNHLLKHIEYVYGCVIMHSIILCYRLHGRTCISKDSNLLSYFFPLFVKKDGEKK